MNTQEKLVGQMTGILAELATLQLGRDIAEQDPETDTLQESLQRALFILQGRTNPGGYYLNVIVTGLADDSGKILIPAVLKSPNDLMRMNLIPESARNRAQVPLPCST